MCKCRFYLFCFLDYRMIYYGVWINWSGDYGVLFDCRVYIYVCMCVCVCVCMCVCGCMCVCVYVCACVYIYIYICGRVRPSRDSSVWLRLTSREQLISTECSMHQMLSFVKMLVVWWTNKKYSVLSSVLQSAQWINLEHIYPQTRVSSFPGLINVARVNE